jgi:hypothetical protein
MAISKPVAVYNAESYVEAQVLGTYFVQNGVEAYPTLDTVNTGLSTFGALPEVFKHQVWIDESNMEAARPLISEYERERLRRQPTYDQSLQSTSGIIEAVCEDCGKTTQFPASKNGTTQDCSHCGAFVDVGDEEPFDWSDS